MSVRRVHVVVLCEGLRDYWFAYKCLTKCGWRRDQIAAKVCPSGKQSAFTYVLKNYPAEVRANRNGKKGERALLVILDADQKPRGGREAELDGRLDAEELSPVQSGERIAAWVPMRQLETWVYFLTHGEADEVTNYKKEHLVNDREYRPAAERFAKLLKERSPLSASTIPSLRRAVVEFDRLRTARTGAKRTPSKR